MKVIVKITQSFKRQVKPLLKKFNSLSQELSQLETELIENPKLGKALGHDLYKIRLAVRSKGKGKSGGLRTISYIDAEILGVIEDDGKNIIVNLISIYDKSETASISEKEITELIKKIQYE